MIEDLTPVALMFIGLKDDIASNSYAYPNPFVNVIVIDNDIDDGRMYDAAGKQVKNLHKGNNDVRNSLAVCIPCG